MCPKPPVAGVAHAVTSRSSQCFPIKTIHLHRGADCGLTHPVRGIGFANTYARLWCNQHLDKDEQKARHSSRAFFLHHLHAQVRQDGANIYRFINSRKHFFELSHICKLTMQPQCGCRICRGRCARITKPTEVVFFTALHNLSPIISLVRIPANPLYPSLRVLSDADIAHVIRPCGKTKISNTIISLDTIDVVNLASRQFPIDIQPSKPMTGRFCPAKSHLPVATAIGAARHRTGRDTSSCDLPSEHPCSLVVIEKLL